MDDFLWLTLALVLASPIAFWIGWGARDRHEKKVEEARFRVWTGFYRPNKTDV